MKDGDMVTQFAPGMQSRALGFAASGCGEAQRFKAKAAYPQSDIGWVLAFLRFAGRDHRFCPSRHCIRFWRWATHRAA
jgi:hypothetical protein